MVSGKNVDQYFLKTTKNKKQNKNNKRNNNNCLKQFCATVTSSKKLEICLFSICHKTLKTSFWAYFVDFLLQKLETNNFVKMRFTQFSVFMLL